MLQGQKRGIGQVGQELIWRVAVVHSNRIEKLHYFFFSVFFFYSIFALLFVLFFIIISFVKQSLMMHRAFGKKKDLDIDALIFPIFTFTLNLHRSCILI